MSGVDAAPSVSSGPISDEKRQAVCHIGEVERLDPEAVARQHEARPLCIPERDGEHASQALEAPLAELLVQMNDHLDVAAGRETVAPPLELGPELDEVVDLSVADADDPSGLVLQRLIACGQVDDRQAAHRNRHRPSDEPAFGIRPAVPELLDRVQRALARLTVG